jgi:hypothetical protein
MYLSLGIVALAIVGCSAQPSPVPVDALVVERPATEQHQHHDQLGKIAGVGNVLVGEKDTASDAPHYGGVMVAMQDVAGKGGEAKPAQDEKMPRKIVYTADLRVIVEDFPTAEAELKKLLKDHHGLIAKSDITGSTGSPRSGTWKLRIPVDEFEDFLQAVAGLGVPLKNSIDSQDVTEEYYDLDTRIKNKKVEEERLRKHLDQSTGKLEEILAVEKELSRVRGEIEHQEGRLRLLANLASLTTVTVTIQEIKNYVPPQAPTFAASIAGTFSASVGLLGAFGRGLVLFGVALVPWLTILLLLGGPIGLLVWWWRSRTVPPTVTPG